ncbi:MAG: dihydrodipicolinate reductase [Gemmatimonadetes bacterium]|nr:dihydrodipicolinate reductase [Gemmatimonadota bacterium]
MTPTKLAVIGDGKMGRAVRELAPDAGFDVVAFLGEHEVTRTGPTDVQLAGAEVAIEFTVPSAAAANVSACARAGVAVVCGTTGWDAELAAVSAAVAAGDGALLWSPNFSLGVQIFARIVECASAEFARTPGVFDAHIIDTHHAAKKDAPSGTARLLAGRARDGLGADVPVTSVRTGHVPGTHEIIFDGAFEQIRLTHTARDRRVFAAGALAAARWIVGRKGVFTMDDLLGGSK